MRSLLALAAAMAATASPVLDETLPALDMSIIEAVNSNPASTWTAGINTKFSDMTIAQAKRLMGTKIGTPEWAAKRAAIPESNIVPLAALPTDFNATSAWPQCQDVIGHIRDQSDCGCCWAFGSTESFNDRLCITHNVTALLSVEDTCSCCTGGGSSSGCDGGFTEDAFNWFSTVGVVTGGDYQDIGKGTSCLPFQLESCDHHEGGPYTPCPNVCPGGDCPTPACKASCSEAKYPTAFGKDKHFAKAEYAVSGVDKIMTDIMTNGPVSASFTVYSDFLTYKTGVYTQQSGSVLGGHAVKIYGWGVEAGTPYWLVANSWNVYWGDFGSFKIIRGKDECGIEDDIVTGSV